MALNDNADEVRRNAAVAFGNIGPEARSAVPALLAAIKGNDLLVELNAIWALGKIGPDAGLSVPTLLEILGQRDSNPAGITINALRAIGEIGVKSDEVIRTLRAAARDDNPKIADAANEARLV